MLLLAYEVKQSIHEGRKFFGDVYNLFDMIGISCTVTAIVLQILASVSDIAITSSLLNALKAVAGLFCWFKLLWFVRGMNSQTGAQSYNAFVLFECIAVH